jgi:RimJ/RimL family protein N-acetyltransferase
MFPEITRDDVFRLETRRLWLRWPRARDAAAHAAIAARREVAEMTARIPHPLPPGSTDQWVIETREANAAGTSISLSAALATGKRELVGSVSARYTPQGRIEIGYVFSPDHWGRGYATEAVQALVDAVFMLTREPAIEATTRVVNPASQRVLRKCGFSHEGSGLRDFPARGGLLPVEEFRLDRKVWHSLKGWAVPDLVGRDRRQPAAEGGVAHAWSEVAPAA